MPKSLCTYYFVLAIITFGFVATTIFSAGSSVDYGYQMKIMRTQQANLETYSQQLRQSLAQEKSLELARNFAVAQNFIPTQNILTLVTTSQLASK